MRKLIILFTLCLICLIPSLNANSLSTSAESIIVMEANSERIIYEKNANEIHLTASICKILTCITAIENGDLDSWCVVSKEATYQIGSSIYLEVNDKIKLIDLLYGLMLRSGNDAAYLISESCGGYNNFINLMNETAKKIGMTSSTFTNPSGLDETSQNYSTCLDMAKLMKYCSKNELYMKINSTKNYKCTTYNGKVMYFTNKHKLIQTTDEFIAGKTGYTEKAKRTLVSYARLNNLDVIIVSFNCGNDFNEHRAFANYVFNNYEMKTIMKSQIINADDRFVSYTPILLEDLNYPTKTTDNEKFTVKVELYLNTKEINYVGNVYLYLDGNLVKTTKLYRYY